MEIEVRKPSGQEIEDMKIKSWPIWEKRESRFDWYYDDKETCYFLEGEVYIEVPEGSRVKIEKGDLAVFPKGLKCVWDIKKKVRKHYNFG